MFQNVSTIQGDNNKRATETIKLAKLGRSMSSQC